MSHNPSRLQPQDPPRKKHQLDDPLPSNNDPLAIPGDPLEIDPGKEDNDYIGDGEGELGNEFEKPHTTTTPSAMYDGIRDGDRDANDEIPYDEEDDFPRGHP